MRTGKAEFTPEQFVDLCACPKCHGKLKHKGDFLTNPLIYLFGCTVCKTNIEVNSNDDIEEIKAVCH